MTLPAIVLRMIAVVVALHALGLYAVVHIDDVRGALRNVRRNAREVAPTAVLLGAVLAVNGGVRNAGVELSWLIGLNITGHIHALEGQFVASLQSLATPALTAYFGFVYVFGYVFLLTFPLVAYALHDDERPLYTTLVAYTLNYGLGLGCYVVFVAYGPRNFMPELVGSLLYTNWPQSQVLTSQINANTNVFPSLHASLATTVAIIGYRFRDVHHRWVPVAAFLAASVSVSTMYLGIHWLTDVIAGVALAVVSVAAASRIASGGRDGESARADGLRGTVTRWVRRHQ